MPLTPDAGQRRSADTDLMSIAFPMFDGEKMVTCHVTNEALEDLSSRYGGPMEMKEAFKLHRPRIESLASAKYDRGDFTGEEVWLTNSDV